MHRDAQLWHALKKTFGPKRPDKSTPSVGIDEQPLPEGSSITAEEALERVTKLLKSPAAHGDTVTIEQLPTPQDLYTAITGAVNYRLNELLGKVKNPYA